MTTSENKSCNDLQSFKPNSKNKYSSYKPSKKKNEFVPIYNSGYSRVSYYIPGFCPTHTI